MARARSLDEDEKLLKMVLFANCLEPNEKEVVPGWSGRTS